MPSKTTPKKMHIARSTWKELASVMGPESIFLLPIGSTEPHGPHLTLDTDVTIAQAQADRSALVLEQAGITAVVLPAIPYGVTRFAGDFPGAISLRPGTLWALIEDLILTLEEAGVRRIVLCNAHLEPEHIEVIRGVVLDHSELTQTKAHAIFPDHTRRKPAALLSKEFQSGECHAGEYETSIVQAVDPEAVRESARQALPAVEIGLIQGIAEGKTTFAEMGAEECYCGDPAAATAAHGEEQLNVLSTIVIDACRAAWPTLFSS